MQQHPTVIWDGRMPGKYYRFTVKVASALRRSVGAIPLDDDPRYAFTMYFVPVATGQVVTCGMPPDTPALHKDARVLTTNGSDSAVQQSELGRKRCCWLAPPQPGKGTHGQ